METSPGTIRPSSEDRSENPPSLSSKTTPTKQHLAQAALLAGGEQYRTLLEASPDPIAVYDLDGAVVYLNKSFQKTFGWSLEELLAKRIPFVPPEAEPETREAIGRIMSGEEVVNFETRRLTRHGRILEVQISSALFKDASGRPVGDIVILRDITERKHVYRALFQSESKYRAIFENTVTATALLDRQGRITLANSEFERLLRIDRTELQGTRQWLECFFDKEPEQWLAPEGEFAPHKRRAPIKFETRLRNRHGHEKFVLGQIAEVPGTPDRILSLLDMTERITAERELKKRDEELRAQCAHLEDAHAALKVVLRHRENDRREIENDLQFNVARLVLPLLQAMRSRVHQPEAVSLLEVIESNLRNVVSPLLRRISSEYFGLTPMEVKIAGLVKEGKTTKEISVLLHVSDNTIIFHRNNIRRKLGLRNRRTSLKSFLTSLED